ncbi:tyrosine-type recombinase/integrase [Salmonella enterica]|nr:tyrosine-type recombinase/integrase [Salmonella enterica]
MNKQTLRYSFQRSGVYYVQVWLPDSAPFRKSLLTDSFREASELIAIITPQIMRFKKGAMTLEQLNTFIDDLLKAGGANPSPFIVVPSNVAQVVHKPVVNVKYLPLGESWKEFKQYKAGKGEGWNIEQAKKNERSFEALLALLGDDFNVYEITRKVMDRVMESIEGLPDARKPPYNKMSVKERLECDDIPEDLLIGASTYNAHIKIFSQFFTSYLYKEKELIEKSPMEGIKQKKENSRYGVYTKSEIKKYINYAIVDCKSVSMKWIILLLIYTGARRGEIAKLTASQVKYNEDCKRWYLHIAEDGDGKTENATREVVLHQDLITYGFLEYVKSKSHWLFEDVAKTSLNSLTQDFITIRDELNIPSLDKDGSRRAVHSLRHTFATYASGWMKDLTHLQVTIGHARTNQGVTKRYIHTIPLESLCYIVDSFEWNQS